MCHGTQSITSEPVAQAVHAHLPSALLPKARLGYKQDMLFHLTPLDGWLEHPDRPYTTASLALEGFIHCSADEEQALVVANARFAKARGPLMVLLIDESLLDAAVRWEAAADGREFPHVHGPVNRAAVVGMLEARRDAEGRWATLAVWS